ncbi:MAG: hypothetical protein MZV70_38535 [Desulfobacterales bacterium]|nr:hypothetical protein [Desulfobacterales bacterium]
MDRIDNLKNKTLKGKGIRESEALELFIEGCAAPTVFSPRHQRSVNTLKEKKLFSAASPTPNPDVVPKTVNSARSHLTIQLMFLPIRSKGPDKLLQRPIRPKKTEPSFSASLPAASA